MKRLGVCFFIVLLLIFAVTSCEQPAGPRAAIAPAIGDKDFGTALLLAETLAGGTSPEDHFFFLPPLAPKPEYGGTFAADLDPVVRVGFYDGVELVPVAEFSTGGKGSERVRTDYSGELGDFYIVNFHLNRFEIPVYSCILFEVFVGGEKLGALPAVIVPNGSEKDFAENGIALVMKRTVPVKFRIEQEYFEEEEYPIIERTWDAGSGTSVWSDKGNWGGGVGAVPDTAVENVIVDNGALSFYPVTDGSYTVGALSVTAGSLTIDTGHTLTISGDITENVGGIIGNGTLQIAALSTVSLLSDLTVTNLDIPATATLDTNGFNLTVSGTFSLAGTLRHNGTGTVSAIDTNTGTVVCYSDTVTGLPAGDSYYNIEFVSGNWDLDAPLSVYGNLTVTAGGSITSAPGMVLWVAGLATLDAGVNPITLGVDAGDIINFGSLNVIGGNVTIYEDSATDLTGVSASNLTLVSRGDITSAPGTVIEVSGLATLHAGNNWITLGNDAGDSTNFGSLYVTGGTVTITEDSATDLAGTVSGNLAVTCAGITQSGALNVAGSTTLTAGAANNIVLANGGNVFGGSVSVVSGLDVTLVASGAIDLGASTVSGNLTVTGTEITQSGELNVAGTTTFTLH